MSAWLYEAEEIAMWEVQHLPQERVRTRARIAALRHLLEGAA